jgi:bis(5'-nucleosidyl)-tetraphosphatase
MKYEKSCGAIIFRQSPGTYEFLVIQQRAGHWGFPKGHVETDETEQQTAIREVAEETGLSIALLPDFRVEEEYTPKTKLTKTVVYFLARATSEQVTCHPREISAHIWLPFPRAHERVSFESQRRILTQAYEFLQQQG